MIRTFIFDFFDVIHQDHQKAWLRERGYTRSGGFAEASDALDRGEINLNEYLQRYGDLSNQSADQVRQQFKDLSKVDTDVVALIRQLHENYQTGLLSNTNSDELNPILTEHSLHELFDEIIISSEVGMAKPDPEIFQLMLDKLQATPAETIFIDDNPDNVAGAKSIGVSGVVFVGAAELKIELAKLGINVSADGAVTDNA